MTITKRPSLKSLDAEKFINGANNLENDAKTGDAPETGRHRTTPMPWDDLNPRIVKGINLRLPEPVWGKLDYLREKTNKSIQKIIMEALLPAIDEQIKGLKD